MSDNTDSRPPFSPFVITTTTLVTGPDDLTSRPVNATLTQLAESRETWMEEAWRWKARAEQLERENEFLVRQGANLDVLRYEMMEEAEGWKARADRYQAALERIADEHPDHPGNTMSIVREALA